MPEREHRESSWRRGWRDAEAFRTSGWFFWGFEVLGSAAFGLLGAALAPIEADRGLYGAVGVIAGLGIAFFFILASNVVRAPIRQRNEAWTVLDAVPGTATNPITPTATIHIQSWEHKPPPAMCLSRGDLITTQPLRCKVLLSSTGDTLVEQIDLEIAGQRASSNWTPDRVGSMPMFETLGFDPPVGTKPGPHQVRLLAFADGQWWASQAFQLDVS